MARPSLPHRARALAGLLLLGAAAVAASNPPAARAQAAMVQWRQQIQSGTDNGSIPAPASSSSQSQGPAAAAPASPPTADSTCPPLRVAQMARIQAGRPVRVKGGNCVMNFN